MWWVAVHVPALSLESWLAGLAPEVAARPAALLAQHRVLAANASAAAQGVLPGMRRATALALVPTLHLGAVDAQRDAQALHALAHVMLGFTPSVCLQPPHTVLAELQASLRCFGGPQRLWQQIQQALQPLGHQLQLAHAPTALAAAWFARVAHQGGPPPAGLPNLIDLPTQLSPLPLSELVEDPRLQQDLQAMGFNTLGALRVQPRAGLSRRLGPGLLNTLDRAYGDAPDPRAWLVPPECFASSLDLHARSDDCALLLAAAAVLLQRLAAWLRARHARVQRFTLRLHHDTRLRASSLGEAGPHVSEFAMALADPSADPAHWQAVLSERLGREALSAPVLSLSLFCDEPVLGPPPDLDLFPALANPREGLMRLVERLQARLGVEGVTRLARLPEHRPERASQPRPAALDSASPVTPPAARLTRPVWLLAQPEPLPERQSRPWLGSEPLRLLAGPERLEAGWWDGGLSARDYFVAGLPAGELVWIYRLRPAPPQGEPGWFLHGRFG
jgi:protein ImuB